MDIADSISSRTAGWHGSMRRMGVKLNIKELATMKGITNARELSRLAAIPPSVAYSYWENRVDNYNRFTLEKIAKALEVNASMLIGEEREPTNQATRKRTPKRA